MNTEYSSSSSSLASPGTMMFADRLNHAQPSMNGINKTATKVRSSDNVSLSSPAMKTPPLVTASATEQQSSRPLQLPQFKITVSPPSTTVPYTELRNRMQNLPQQFNLVQPNKFLDCQGMGVNPISTTKQYSDLLNDPDHEVIIIDLRPFNQYNVSRLTGALSVCVPTTLLKRKSFHLDNIFKTMVKSQELRMEELFSGEKQLRLIFYDSSSNMSHCSPHFHQMITKFLEGSLSYDKSIELYMINNGFSLFIDDPSLVDSSRFKKSSTTGELGFSTFLLPSADPASQFLMSVKKNINRPDTRDTKLTIPVFSSINQFPRWLQRYTERDSIKTIVNNFVNIETMENTRIGSIAERRPTSAAHSHVSNSPDCQLQGGEHGFKNRYPNILPYEHSRVKLVPSPMSSVGTPNAISGQQQQQQQPFFFRSSSTSSLSPTSAVMNSASSKHDDYFNANFLSVPQLNDEVNYIATQAPLPSTIHDFWKVVWHNNVEIVISLTNLHENGMKKSDVYWNNSSHVELLSEEPDYDGFENLTVRKIKLIKRGKSKVIHQLHFTAWPDFGLVDYKQLLRLIAIKDSIQVKDKTSPVVVHCSAGCGRTGVFITIDVLVSAMKRYLEDNKSGAKQVGNRIDFWNTDEDLIDFTVQQLRKQRISMVQSVDQFVLCYQAMLQYCVTSS